ncbi:MAG: glutamyl-tRNA reductase [Nitrososphaerales archaeon]
MSQLDIMNARVTYRKVPIHILEKFTFKDLDTAYKSFKADRSIKECVILQTCNRVEIYVLSDNAGHEKLLHLWGKNAGLTTDMFRNYLELSFGEDVVHHLLKLASGLDSLVIGEDQILGQVKRAFDSAKKGGYAGVHLGLLFDNAIKVGGKVRTSTGINKGTVSYGSMAVKLAEEHLGGLNGKNIMIIGSGEAACLVAKTLKKRKIGFMVTSRTLERARSFSQTAGGEPIAFENAFVMLKEIDVLFVASTAPYFLVPFERAAHAMEGRRKPLVILDLSNPRTVEEKVAMLHGVKLINIDEVSALVERNMNVRMQEVEDVERIIEEGVYSVQARMKRLEVDPAVDVLFKKAHAIRKRELEKALQILGDLDEDQKKVIDQLSHAIVEGILSNPMDTLRKVSQEGDKELMKAILKLFQYER